MEQRKFGKIGRMVSEIGLGTWQLGTKWGEPFNEEEAQKILEASYENGITLIDTADIYNGGNSERAIGRFLKQHPDHFFVVTKCGRGLKPHAAEGYTPRTWNVLWTAVCSGWVPRDWTWCCCIARPHRYTKRTNFSPVWTSWWKRERLPLTV